MPLGMVLVLRLVPAEVMADCHKRANAAIASGQPKVHWGVAIVVALWLLLAVAIALGIWRALSH